ncbi:hypothetical protein DERP_003112 [Dermatophagoides pteronyssinus]|uniref:Uncharacterized protein n=1 Tax=Dermatophagoides pteronyssinus TaxID=6956 RepID=A0ABQ8JIM4_DERPT|nr:hypothetical protein DERP_003112 [Dermatophagoides pteronyssinus]
MNKSIHLINNEICHNIVAINRNCRSSSLIKLQNLSLIALFGHQNQTNKRENDDDHQQQQYSLHT